MKRVNQYFGLLLVFLLVCLGILYPIHPIKAQSGFQATVYPNIIKKSCVFQFSVPLTQDLKGGDWFKIFFPEGYELPDPGRLYGEDSEPLTIKKLVLRSLSINLIQMESIIDLFYINYKENSMIFFLSKTSGILFQKSHPLLINLGSSNISLQSFANIHVNSPNYIFPVKAGVYSFRFLTNNDLQEKISNPVTILPISGLVNDLVVSPIPAEFNRHASYQLSFKTGLSHELKANQTWLSIKFPKEIQHFSLGYDSYGHRKYLESWMSRYITVNGVPVNQIQSDTFIKILCPVNVGANELVNITFLRDFGLQNPMNPGDYTITIAHWIEYEEDPVKSKVFSIIKGKPVILNDQHYSFYICLGEGEEINPDQFLYILLPDQAELTPTDKKAIKMNNKEPKNVVYQDHVITITCNQYFRAGDVIEIDFILLKWNPILADYSYAYKLDEKNTWTYSDPYVSSRYIVPKIATIEGKNKSNQPFNGIFTIQIKKDTPLKTDDSINIEFPVDMQMPETININGIRMESTNYKIQRIDVVDHVVKIVVINFENITNYATVSIHIFPEANIQTPKRESCWIDILISTSKDPSTITVTTYLDPEPSVATIESRNGIKGQKDWLTSPPLLLISQSIPGRLIQINNHTYFTPIEPIQLPMGQYSLELNIYTPEEAEKWKTNRLAFKIDTIKPLVKLTAPKQDVTFSKTEIYLIQGAIETTPTHWNIGFNDVPQKTIDQEIIINQKTVFFEPESGAFQASILLQEGLNPVLIEVEDWAGNKTETTLTIAYKTGILLQIGSKKMLAGDKEIIMDVAPMLRSGRTFIPIRNVGEVWGVKFQLETNAKKETISIILTWENHNIRINLVTKSTTKDGKLVQLDAIPFIFNGRLMLPLRFLSEQLGKKITWDSTSQTILIL